MFLIQYLKSGCLILFAIVYLLTACEVVELDSAGKPIIPMSAEEAASLANLEPNVIADKIWHDLISDANKTSVTLNELEQTKENDKSYFVKFKGTIESIDEKSKSITVNLNTGNQIIPIQVGSIIKGNAIRDASSLLSFDQFKNQIQYSRLSKALNKTGVENIIKIDGSSVGKKVDVLSALTIKNNQIQDVVPLNVQWIE
ncbi:DUF2291 family protein [Lonepinella koalarum]|uniref:DUF2291 family protein n=1 Tax=Lonepinella koalarum TaxID=53417 RepID=UPI0011E49DB5|nr:DUF2291 family protein [Lonepinella koalarum]TYG34806.1 DUF2291 family protein [Lonepinella koalarum]